MRNKKLKICEQPYVISECWTCYKMMILQTESVFSEWLTSHMDLFLCDNGVAVFGDHAEKYSLSYFNEILDITENKIDDVTESEIVDYVIRKINEGYYVKLDLDFKKLHGVDDNEKRIHEIIIYGYDEEKRVVYLPLLIGERFKESEVSFDAFSAAYGSMWEQFMTPVAGREMKYSRRDYVLGLTLLRVNKEYTNPNAQFDFLHKLEYEKIGLVHTKKALDCDEPNISHTGLARLHRLAEIINGYVQHPADRISDEWLMCYKTSFLKIYEHHSMLKDNLEWFIRKTKVDEDKLEAIGMEYEECRKTIYNIILLIIKYYMTREEDILGVIVKKTREVYDKEKDILDRMNRTAWNAYLLTLGV